MTENTDKPETEEIRTESEAGPYVEAISAYLAAADWIDETLDRPLVVHARSIAVSLDRQMAAKGEIQSALASSFDKALFRLEARRPKPEPAPGRGGDPDQSDIFEFLSD